MSDVPAIRARGVQKRFGRDEVLRGVDLEVDRGRRLGIIGPAAGGKSVLLKLLVGLERADAGTIEIGGVELGAAREAELMALRQSVGFLFQNYALFDFMTVAENVAFPLERRGELGADEIRDRVAARLEAVGLAGSEQKRPSELSGGMKKRVGIARATVARPELVFYDEPTAGLDPVTTSKIYDLLRADQAETGGTVVAVSSDVDALCGFADTIAMLYQGRLSWVGRPDDARDAGDPAVRQFIRGELEGPL